LPYCKSSDYIITTTPVLKSYYSTEKINTFPVFNRCIAPCYLMPCFKKSHKHLLHLTNLSFAINNSLCPPPPTENLVGVPINPHLNVLKFSSVSKYKIELG